MASGSSTATSEVDFWPIPGEGATTNCCFGGPDGTWLFATDGLPGQVVVWHDLPDTWKGTDPVASGAGVSAVSRRRTVAVTGSASGIGAALCTRPPANGGAQVVGVDRHDADVVADLGTR